eukprot:TRINITY_DN62905_c0_g1_i1.p1 TRINITY_DN62905_c0_g1~~TRINITY_DN62905_c0_g1_i1.p1  ORF type:complete len:327 (-),score=27.63 TRINITY_DN62905_c0_g1_i1:44-982(-)
MSLRCRAWCSLSRREWSGELHFSCHEARFCPAPLPRRYETCGIRSGSSQRIFAQHCQLRRAHAAAASMNTCPTPNRLKETDEGVLIHEASPYRDSMHLVWGNVLWDAGLALAKFFAWHEGEASGQSSVKSKAILELGAGTGVVGLTLGKSGALVTLTDCEPEVISLLRRNATANSLGETIRVHELDWRDKSTYLPASSFDIVVAADVLYSNKIRWFMPALLAHMARRPETRAFVACPPRKDSPLAGFFTSALHAGLTLERLEDQSGNAVGATSGSATDVFRGARFVPLGEERFAAAASDGLRVIQIFRLSWA